MNKFIEVQLLSGKIALLNTNSITKIQERPSWGISGINIFINDEEIGLADGFTLNEMKDLLKDNKSFVEVNSLYDNERIIINIDRIFLVSNLKVMTEETVNIFFSPNNEVVLSEDYTLEIINKLINDNNTL